MKTYIINLMQLIDDVLKTEHFISLDEEEKELFLDYHKYLGNQVIEDLELY